MFEPGNIAQMVDALLSLCENKPLRLKMANAAKLRTLESFSSENITAELVKFYSMYVPVRNATYYETEDFSNAA